MADDLLNRLGTAAIQKLPLPLQRTMRGTTFRFEGGPTESIASGRRSGNIAGVIPGQNVINIMDLAAFRHAPEQIAMHEGIHQAQENFAPAIQAKIPPDDPKNPYQVWDTNRVARLLAKGGTIANVPREQASATGQYYQAQGGEQSAPKEMRDTYGKLIETIPMVPQSVIMPTDPMQKGINTTPRPPQVPYGVPGMRFAQQTYTKGQAPPDADPPPPAGYTIDSAPASNDPAPPAGYTLDATPTPNAPTAPAGNTLSAAPAPSWGQQAVEDLQQGGNRTFIGRTLGHLQGRGNQGYTGLESGVSPGSADYVGSPFLGAARTVAGAQEIPQHPFRGAWDTAKGLFQTATLPATFMGGPAADAGMQAIPSKSAASNMFKSLMADAGDATVNLNNASDPLLRVQEIAARGASMPQAAGKLLRRATQPNSAPMTYREARDFASNISNLSANDSMKMTAPMRSSINDLRSAFHQDIGDAADTVGRGQDYKSALQEYASAMNLRDNAKAAGLWALKKGAAAAGVGAAGYEAHKLFR